jgi:hypothetical protein
MSKKDLLQKKLWKPDIYKNFGAEFSVLVSM